MGAHFAMAVEFNTGPTIVNINPTTTTVQSANGPGLTITVNGTNFSSASVVKWQLANSIFAETDLNTNPISNVQVTAFIPANYITNPGTFNIWVANPNGEASSIVQFTVTSAPTTCNPVPILTALSQSSTPEFSPGFGLIATGVNFMPGPGGTSLSIGNFDGSPRTTNYVSASQRQIQLPSSDFLTAGTFDITITNPQPNFVCQTTSNIMPFEVTAQGGGQNGTIKIIKQASGGNGTFNFNIYPSPPGTSNPSASINTSNNNTTTVSAPAGSYAIKEIAQNGWSFNGATCVKEDGMPTGSPSSGPVNGDGVNSLVVEATKTTTCTFVNTGASSTCNPVPTINTLSAPIAGLMPSSTPVQSSGGPGLPFTVNGTNFIPGPPGVGSEIEFNGNPLSTTFISATKLTTTIPAFLLLITGSFPVVVANPQTLSPCAPTSNAVPFTVTAITPTTGSIKVNKTIPLTSAPSVTNATFSYNITPSPSLGSTFTINVDRGQTKTYTINNLPFGAYTITENNLFACTTPPAWGWCVAPSPSCIVSVSSITIIPECSFTNTLNLTPPPPPTTGTITVNKVKNGPVASVSTPFSFTSNIPGYANFSVNIGPLATAGSSTLTNVPFNASGGTYTITETTTGWITTGSPCTVTVSATNPNPTCSVVNSPTPPSPTTGTITINKTKNGLVASTTTPFGFSIASTSSAFSGYNFSVYVGPGSTTGATTITVPYGTYTITETTTGWITTGSPCTVTVSATNPNPTCSVVNSPTPPAQGTLKIIKTTTGGDGTFEFTVFPTPSAMSVTTVDGTSSNNNPPDTLNLSPGVYSIDETIPNGWDLTTSNCTNGTPNAAVIVANQTTTCTFKDEKTVRHLEIIKNTTGGDETFTFNGGYSNPYFSPFPSDYIPDITTQNGSSSATLDFNGPYNGSFAVAEDEPPTGWTFNSAICRKEDGTSVGSSYTNGFRHGVQDITIPPGQTVTCIFRNTTSSPSPTPQGSRYKFY